jgi:hypothetical protein
MLTRNPDEGPGSVSGRCRCWQNIAEHRVDSDRTHWQVDLYRPQHPVTGLAAPATVTGDPELGEEIRSKG